MMQCLCVFIRKFKTNFRENEIYFKRRIKFRCLDIIITDTEVKLVEMGVKLVRGGHFNLRFSVRCATENNKFSE